MIQKNKNSVQINTFAWYIKLFVLNILIFAYKLICGEFLVILVLTQEDKYII